MNLKVKENLFIIGDRVISYETEVARIKGNSIIMNGKYSRTTGKQMSYLAALTEMKVVHSIKAGRYFKFYYGVKCDAPNDIKVSATGAKKILSKLKYVQEIEKAAVLAYNELWAIDRAFIKMELGTKGWTHEKMVAASTAFQNAVELGMMEK